MKLLFDQDLSRKLVAALGDVYHDSEHVMSLGLDMATDRQVCDHAAAHGFVVVSKDLDFNELAILLGPPPKVIWLRVGNVPTAVVERMLRASAEAITGFVDDADDALLVLPDLPFGSQ